VLNLEKGYTIDALISAEQDIERQIAADIQRLQESIPQRVNNLYNNFHTMKLLADNGFPYRTDCVYSAEYDKTYHVEQKDLTRLYKVIGKLKLQYNQPVEGTRENLIWVYLTSEKYPAFTFKYQRKLPRKYKGKGGAKCKLKTVIRKERVLVCE
jgi:hypothetical protein